MASALKLWRASVCIFRKMENKDKIGKHHLCSGTSLVASLQFTCGLKYALTVAPFSCFLRLALCRFDLMCSFTSYRPEAATFTSRQHKLHLAYCSPALLGTIIPPNFSNHSFWNFPEHFRLFAAGAILKCDQIRRFEQVRFH